MPKAKKKKKQKKTKKNKTKKKKNKQKKKKQTQQTDSKKLRSKFETLRREIKEDVRKQHDLYVNNMIGDVRQILETSIGTSIVRKRQSRYSAFERRGGSGITASEIEQAEEFSCHFKDVFRGERNFEVSNQKKISSSAKLKA